MLRNLLSQARSLTIRQNVPSHGVRITNAAILYRFTPDTVRCFTQFALPITNTAVQSITSRLLDGNHFEHNIRPMIHIQPIRQFHQAGSKIHYLDFRHRFRTNQLRLHILLIKRQKMKKHRKRKWRRKFKCLLAKRRLKREIGKEKSFRVELLTAIRRAEEFDPREYALKKIAEIKSKPREPTKEETLEELKELIRKHRYQTDYIKPKHRRLSFYTTR